jgi:crotonobetainyl-CoA:carnitine CoA-transferase CaiB-like acyl-CoA transferase
VHALHHRRRRLCAGRIVADPPSAPSCYLASGEKPQRHGNAHANIVPYQAFATRDGHIVAAVGNDAQFARFVTILGVPELSSDPKFQRNADRVRNRAELLSILTSKIRTWSKAELLLALDGEKIPAGPINEMSEVFEDPHVVARGLVVEQRLHDGGATTKLIGNPIRFSRTPIEYGSAPPRLGAHTEEILCRDLSMAESEVNRLEKQGIVSKSRV